MVGVNEGLERLVLVDRLKDLSEGIEGPSRAEKQAEVGGHFLFGDEAFHGGVVEF